jgi:hypothetical protein
MAEDSLTLVQLLEAANRVYPDGQLSWYFDEATGESIRNPDGGDTLALFIVLELAETFDNDAERTVQLGEAIRVMERAASELNGVVAELSRLLIE